MTWSSALSTCNNSLLKRATYYLSNSPSVWQMLRRCPVGFLCLCPPVKWQTKPLLSCSKFTMVHGGILLNQTLVAPFSVVGKALHIISSGVIYRCIKVLNDSMWSKESFEPSHGSSWGRRNFGGRGRFNILVVNGKSVLCIIPSKFSMAFSFTALLSSSISLLMLRSSLSILDKFSSDSLFLLLIWLSNPSSLWFPSILGCCSSSFSFSVVRCRSSFWDSVSLLSSSFWRVNSAMFAVRAWICYAACSGFILYYENLFCKLGKWLD